MNGTVLRNDLALAFAKVSEAEKKRRADARCTGKGYEPPTVSPVFPHELVYDPHREAVERMPVLAPLEVRSTYRPAEPDHGITPVSWLVMLAAGVGLWGVVIELAGKCWAVWKGGN